MTDRAHFQQSPKQGKHELVAAPGDKVLQQFQSNGMTFFRVKLGGEQIAPCHGGSKIDAVIAATDDQFISVCFHVVTVYKLKATVLLNTLPERVTDSLADLVPTHVRHLQALTICIPVIATKKSYTAGKNIETVNSAVFLAVGHHRLHADANRQYRLFHHGLLHRVIEPGAMDFSHAVANRTDPWEHYPVGIGYVLRALCHYYIRIGSDMFQRLGNGM